MGAGVNRTRRNLGLLLVGTSAACLAASAADPADPNTSLEQSACVRPAAGDYAGACDARQANTYADLAASPYTFYRWMGCRQSEQGLPSGGYGDAVFFSEMVPEWEREIDALLPVLRKFLNAANRAYLETEQSTWEKARARADARRFDQPLQPGTMYIAIAAFNQMEIPEKRAVERACRVEKFSPPPERIAPLDEELDEAKVTEAIWQLLKGKRNANSR